LSILDVFLQFYDTSLKSKKKKKKSCAEFFQTSAILWKINFATGKKKMLLQIIIIIEILIKQVIIMK